jgi:diguanylate cyclase (GGDEF)-like protein
MNARPKHDDGTSSRSPARLLDEQVSLVYSQLRLNLLISPLMGSLIAYVLWPVGARRLLVGWVAALTVLAVWRQANARAYHASPAEARDARLWGRRFLVSLAAASAGWGVGGWLVMRVAPPGYQAFVFVFLVGMAAGTLATYAAHASAAAIGMSLILGPPTLYMLLAGDRFHAAMGIGALFFAVAASRGIRLMNGALRRSFALAGELEWLSRSDALSGLGNRRAFTEFGEITLANASRAGRPCAIIVLDVDHFKSINDQSGHAAGDAVIRALGAMLSAAVRAGEFAGRIGGEEFAVILPDATLEQGRSLAGRILGLARTLRPEFGGKSIAFTVSIGVAASVGEAGSFDELLARADAALYEAKRGGRDRVDVAGGER